MTFRYGQAEAYRDRHRDTRFLFVFLRTVVLVFVDELPGLAAYAAVRSGRSSDASPQHGEATRRNEGDSSACPCSSGAWARRPKIASEDGARRLMFSPVQTRPNLCGFDEATVGGPCGSPRNEILRSRLNP